MNPANGDGSAHEKLSGIEFTLSPTNWGEDESMYEKTDDFDRKGNDGYRMKGSEGRKLIKMQGGLEGEAEVNADSDLRERDRVMPIKEQHKNRREV